MPSSASPSLLFEVQAAGENLNTWGDTRLNVALKMLEAGGHGFTSHTLTANKSLTYTNYTLTDGTDYVQKIAAASTGSYTLTVGGYEREYLIWNASSYDQTIASSGGGDSVTVAAGEVVPVYCDATNVVRYVQTTADTPTENGQIANKSYVDAAVLAVSAGNLPGQSASTAGAVIQSDGSSANWKRILAGNVITSTTTLVANDEPYFADTSGGAFTATLPASPSERDYVIVDVSRDAPSNNLTIGRNSETIQGDAADFIIDIGPRRYVFQYLNSDWKVS